MASLITKLRPDFAFNTYSLVNSLKATLACLIGLILVEVLRLEQPQWVLISSLIVMAAQYRLGAAMIKGYARLFATAMGSSLASAILFLFSNDLILVYSFLFLFLTLFIYLASNSKDYSYSYTLGAVTMVIIVVSSNPQLRSALDRMIEIMLGVSIAILVSRFVLPIRAEKLLYINIARTTLYLKEVYQFFIHENRTFYLNSEEKNIEEEIIKNLATQPVLIKEACTESLFIRKQKNKFFILLKLQRRLLRSIYMLQYTLRVSLKCFSNIIKTTEFQILHKEIIEMMQGIADKLRNKDFPLPKHDLEGTYARILTKVRTMLTDYSFEEKNKIHAFLFCQNHVILVLNQMERIISEIEEPLPPSNRLARIQQDPSTLN